MNITLVYSTGARRTLLSALGTERGTGRTVPASRELGGEAISQLGPGTCSEGGTGRYNRCTAGRRSTVLLTTGEAGGGGHGASGSLGDLPSQVCPRPANQTPRARWAAAATDMHLPPVPSPKPSALETEIRRVHTQADSLTG